MSDEYAEQIKKEHENVPAPGGEQGRSYSITVTMHPNGQLELSGPIGNKVLAGGLLQAGLQELARWHLMKELEAIAKSSNGGGVAGLLRKMGRG